MSGAHSGHGQTSPPEAGRAGQIIAAEIAAAKDFLGADGVNAAALLPVLHALQAEFGFIDPALIPEIAAALNITKAEVRGVISFYHDFRTAPAGKRTLRLCMAEACQATGCKRIADHLADRHGLKPGDTTPDGSLTLQAAYCLGNCALGPAAMLDDRLAGQFDEAAVDALIAEVRS